MKRFLGVILAVVMCISMLPIATSVASAAGNENEFVFTCKAYGITSAVRWADLAVKKLSDVDSDSSDPWRTATSYYGTSIMARESGFRFVAKTARATSGIGVVGMELDVSLDGSVTPTFTYIARASAPIVDVYLVKADVTGPLNSKGTTTGTPADFVMPTTGNGTGDSYYFLKSLGSAYKLGTVDMYASEVTEKSVVFDNFELSGEGSYYLLINSVGTNASYVAYGSSNEYEAEFVSLKLVVNEETPDKDYIASFDAVEKEYITSGNATVNVYTYAGETESVSLNNTVALGENYSTTAPEKDGYTFLCWTKGASENKQILSYTNDVTYKPGEGANYLLAVYVKNGEEADMAEFYNANGQLVKTLTANGIAPEYPSLAGYGKATAWTLYSDGVEVKAGDAISVSGTRIYVAKYKDAADTVTVNGESYIYGDKVTLTAEKVSGKVFKGWKKNGEIISVSENYSFFAYEDCTVEAVYADSVPFFSGKFIKIAIDSFVAGDETAIMAEFIGLDDAVEKGVMCGTKKIPMHGDGNQFTIIADMDTTYLGYAILKDGDTFTQVTDGEYTE